MHRGDNIKGTHTSIRVGNVLVARPHRLFACILSSISLALSCLAPQPAEKAIIQQPHSINTIAIPNALASSLFSCHANLSPQFHPVSECIELLPITSPSLFSSHRSNNNHQLIPLHVLLPKIQVIRHQRIGSTNIDIIVNGPIRHPDLSCGVVQTSPHIIHG